MTLDLSKKRRWFCFHEWDIYKEVKNTHIKDYSIVRTTEKCRKCEKKKIREVVKWM